MRNRLYGAAAVAALLAQLAYPAAVAAQGNDAGTAAGRGPGGGEPRVGSGVCQNIDQAVERILERTDERLARVRQQRAKRDGKLFTMREMRENGLFEARGRQDERHRQRFEILLERAEDEGVVAAVEEFLTAADEAVAARRATVDEAVVEYRAAIDELVEGRRATVDSAAESLFESVRAAAEQAQTACADGQGGADVRQALNDSIRAARQAFAAEMKGMDGLSETIRELSHAMQETVREAFDTFKSDVDAAAGELKDQLAEMRPADGDEEDEADEE
ncbi:hypothetical protein ACFL26_00660 [Patescibacteria group bacterium]